MSTNSHPTTFTTAAAAFLREFEQLVRSGERAAATLAMHRLHVRYLGGAIPPTTPIASIGESAVNSCAEHESEGRRARPTVAGTVSKRISTLRQILSLAQRRGWRGPLPAFPRYRRGYKPRTEHLRNRDELELLCSALELDRADWVRLAVFTGQHPADVERMKAFIDADPFGSPPWLRLRNTKNRRPERVVLMPRPLVTCLRARFRREQLAPGAPIVPAWPKDARSKRLRAVGARLGLDVRRASDLRRTCGSWAAHELRSITVGLKDWLGHTSLAMLERIYAHALPPALVEVARALARAARAPRRSPKRIPPRAQRKLAAGDGPRAKRKAPEAGETATGAVDPREGVPARARVRI